MERKPTPPLTAQLSQHARRQLGLSQRDVIEATGLPGYKLKQWEARGLDIDVSDLRTLRDFYADQALARGLSFEAIEAHHAGRLAPEPAPEPPSPDRSRFGFLISEALPPEVADQLMADMEASDDRVAALIGSAVQTGLLGGITAETELMIQEVFGHLAANHLRFRCLQGRNIIAPTRDEAQTVGHVLAQWVTAKGVAHVGAAPVAALEGQE